MRTSIFKLRATAPEGRRRFPIGLHSRRLFVLPFLITSLFAQTGPPLATQNTGTRQIGWNVQPLLPNGINPMAATLFAYGPTFSSDSAVPVGDDNFVNINANTAQKWVGAGPEGSSLAMNFYGNSYGDLYVNNNGLLSFTRGISAYSNSPLQNLTTPAVSPFWADVDTRAANGGTVWYRTTQSTAELVSIGTRIESSFLGAQNFNPTFATIVTWDKVGYYTMHVDRVNTFQAVIVSDGITTYTMFLYPDRAIWWDSGDVSIPNGPTVGGASFAAVGVTAGDGINATEITGSRTNSARDLWFLSNTAPSQPGIFAFEVGGTAPPLVVAGNLTLPGTMGTAAAVVQLGANSAGHTITSTTAAGSLTFNQLLLDNPTDSVRFTDHVVVLANAANAISQGNLTFADNAVLVARTTNSVNGGTLTLASNAKLAIHAEAATGEATALNFSTVAGNSGLLDLRGYSAAVGGLQSLDAGAGRVTNSGTTASTLTVGGNSATQFSGVLEDGTGTIALVKTGAGTLTLSSATAYTGGTTINAGTLVAAHNGEIGTFAAGSAVTVNSGGTLRVTASDSLGWGNGNAKLVVNGGTVTTDGSAGQHTSLQNLTMTGGRLTDTGGNGQYFLNGPMVTLASGATATIDSWRFELGPGWTPGTTSLTVADGAAAVDLDISSTVMGSGALVKNGAGLLRLTGANFYAGGTTLKAGTLLLGSAGALPTSGLINFNGGALQFSAANTNDYSGRFSTAAGQQYRLDTNGQNVTLASALSSSGGSLTKLGTGTLTLTGNNSYTGGTTLSDGTLQFGTGTVTGTPGQGEIINNAILAFNPAGALQVTNGISGTGLIQKLGTGTLTLSGSNTYTGGTTIHAGTLIAAHNMAAGTGVVTVEGGIFFVDTGITLANEVLVSGGSYLRALGAGANLAGAINTTSSFAGGRPDTTAEILQGTLSAQETLESSFKENSSALNDAIRLSDVYSLHGTGNDQFVLEISLTGLTTNSYLGWLDTDSGSATYNQWINAVNGNSGGTPTFISRGYNAATDFHLGYFGVDVTTGSAWAVLNHNSDFAVIPEPGTLGLVLGAGLLILAVRRRKIH